MSVTENIIIALKGQTAHFDKSFNKADKKLKGFSKNAEKSASRIKKAFSGLKSKLAAGLSVYAAGSFAKSSLNAYMEQEDAVNKINAALKVNGDYSLNASKDLQEFASSIQKITTYGDEALLPIMALGSSMGKLSGEELKKATKAAIGLSKAYNIDLVAAMRLVARAANGDTASLKRYGITIDSTLPAQEKFNELLRIGAKNFSLATEEIKTHRGQIQQLKNDWGDLKEDVGGFLMKAAVGWGYVFKGMGNGFERPNNHDAIADRYASAMKEMKNINLDGMSDSQRLKKQLELFNELYFAAQKMAYAKKREGEEYQKYIHVMKRAAEERKKIQNSLDIVDAADKEIKKRKEAIELQKKENKLMKQKAARIAAMPGKEITIQKRYNNYLKRREEWKKKNMQGLLGELVTFEEFKKRISEPLGMTKKTMGDRYAGNMEITSPMMNLKGLMMDEREDKAIKYAQQTASNTAKIANKISTAARAS